MITCSYKKTFLKDLAKIKEPNRSRIEKLVFEKIPELDNLFKLESGKRIIFYRVKSRNDIYKIFP